MSNNIKMKDPQHRITKINPNPKEFTWNYIYNNNQKTSFDQDQEEYMINAFSWPPRSYTCSFCKREFRSAQALGGHMNVHRKDRARLRQSPPLPLPPPQPIPRDNIIHQYNRYGSVNSTPNFLNLNLNHNPNPNPNPNFSPSSSNISTAKIPFCSLTNSKPPLSSSLPSPYSVHDNNDIKKWPWNSTIPVEYGATSRDQYHYVELDHDDHDGDYSLINLKGTDHKKMYVCCGVGSQEVPEGLAGKEKVYHNCKGFNKKMRETATTSKRSVGLDLEIGLIRDKRSEIGPGNYLDLDLELRLGYSN